MDEFDLIKKKKKGMNNKHSGLFDEMDVDSDSDHPVHEEFVDSKKLRKVKKR